MATAIIKDDSADVQEEDLSSLLCGICFDWYKRPRKLAVCSHSFCEDCIFRHLTTLKSKEENVDGLRCLVCRQVNPSPETDQDVLEWVQTLELNADLVQQVKHHIGDLGAKVELCVRCKESKKAARAERYCLDCQESFCESCCEFGHRFKGLRDHSVVDVGVEKVRNAKEVELSQMMFKQVMCPVHNDMRLTLYCSDNGRFCCVKCALEDIKKINNLKEIIDHTSEEQNEEAAGKIMDKIAKLKNVSKAIIEAKKANMEEKKNETEYISIKIGEMRKKVIDLFDALEENVNQQYKALKKKYKPGAEEEIEKLQNIICDLDLSQTFLENSKQQRSVDVLYVEIHNLEKRIKEHETSVLEIKQHCTKQGFELEVQEQFDDVLKVGPNDIAKLVKVKETSEPVRLPDYTDKHLLKYCSIRKDADYQIKAEGARLSPFFTGIAGIPSNQIIIVDNANGCCCLVNADYKVVSSCKLTDQTEKPFFMKQPMSVSFLKNGTAAISIPELRKLLLVATDESFRIVGEVHTKDVPFALCGLSNGDLAVSWSSPCAFGILKFSKHCRFEQTVCFDRDTTGRIFKSFNFIAVDENRSHIIQPCVTDKAVYCFDFKGDPKFAYTHDELAQPLGVALDREGNIYVCESTNSCIHVLTPEGLAIRLIKDSCLQNPTALCLRADNSEFVVSCGRTDRVSVFKLIH